MPSLHLLLPSPPLETLTLIPSPPPNPSPYQRRHAPRSLPLLHPRPLPRPHLHLHPASVPTIPFLYSPDKVNFSIRHGEDLHDFLRRHSEQIWTRNLGHPPLFDTSFLKLPEFQNLTVLTIESHSWSWQKHVVPYLTSFRSARCLVRKGTLFAAHELDALHGSSRY